MLRTFRYLAAAAFFTSLLVPPSTPRAFALTAAQAPILVITSAANPFTGYAAEILRAEGLNEFDVQDIDAVAASPGVLSSYDVVVLGQVPLTAAQTSMFVNWVSGGGNLIAMRPDKALYPLLGLSATPGVLSNGYLLFDRSTRPAAGLVGETIQFHGDADI